jgi:prevent-host-death family protein
MISATIFEAKTKLSQFVKEVQNGKTVIITSGRNKTPVAKLEAIHPKRPQRLGLLATPGFKIPDSFWEPLPDDELDLWDGGAE